MLLRKALPSSFVSRNPFRRFCQPAQIQNPKEFWSLPDNKISNRHIEKAISHIIFQLKKIYQNATAPESVVEELCLHWRTLFRYQSWLTPTGSPPTPTQPGQQTDMTSFHPYTFPLSEQPGRFLAFVSTPELMQPYIAAQGSNPCFAFPVSLIDAIAFLQTNETLVETKKEEKIIGCSFDAKPGMEFLSVSLTEPSFNLTLNAHRVEMSLLRSSESILAGRDDPWISKEFLQSFKHIHGFTKLNESNEISFSGSPTAQHGRQETVYNVLLESHHNNQNIVLWWQRPVEGPFTVLPTTSKALLEKIDG